MATKPNIAERIKQGQGAKIYIQEEKITQDSDIIPDNKSDIVSDNKSDVSGDKSSDNVDDKIRDNDGAVTSDNNSDIISDINSDILKPKKQPKYTDLHERRTHYLTKENIEFIEHLYDKYNQDKSETVNRALMLYRMSLKKTRKNGK